MMEKEEGKRIRQMKKERRNEISIKTKMSAIIGERETDYEGKEMNE